MAVVNIDELTLARDDVRDDVVVSLKGGIAGSPTTRSADSWSRFHVVFSGAIDIRLPRISGLPLNVSGLVIDDIRAEYLDGVAFRVSDYEDDVLGLTCRGYEVIEPPGIDLR